MPETKARPVSPAKRAIDFLSSLGLATVLLLLLGVLTWFATLEQIDNGLQPTLEKYFHWKSPFLLPELKGKLVPLPLPGGYWVSALLLVNLTIGGILRMRKGWRHSGNLIAHFGIIFLLAGGGVAHHFSERGNMAVSEGQVSDTAEDYYEYVIEVAEIVDKQPKEIRVIRGEYLTDLTDGKTRLCRLPGFPFSLELGGYLRNALPTSITEVAPKHELKTKDGYYLMAREPEKEAERNTAACYAKLVYADGTKSEPFIIAGASFHPFTVKVEDRIFTVDMRKKLWPMPFRVRLDEFSAEFHPGTMRPAKFVSEITRIEQGSEAKYTIQMNEPMRYKGLTFFQASYGPQGAGPGEKLYSVFEIVRNPADKWPEYSLYVVTLGMLITFGIKLFGFIASSSRKNRHG